MQVNTELLLGSQQYRGVIQYKQGVIEQVSKAGYSSSNSASKHRLGSAAAAPAWRRRQQQQPRVSPSSLRSAPFQAIAVASGVALLLVLCSIRGNG